MTYSSVDEVAAICRRILDGNYTFTTTTTPTQTEVETFISYASQTLDDALSGVGFVVPITNTTAQTRCDAWVTLQAAKYVELSMPYGGWDGAEGGSRLDALASVESEADIFASRIALGWKRQGVAVATAAHEGLTFTALNKHSERSDPDSDTLEQPKFRRGQWTP